MVFRSIPVLAVLALPFSGCETDVTPRLAVSGLDRAAVDVEIEELGELDEDEVSARADTPGVDGLQRAAAGACQGACRWAQVSLYVKNTTAAPLAPPVVRVDAPEGKPARLPLSLGAEQIDPGRTGRIRWLIELYPGQEHVDVRLSSSVFFSIEEPGLAPASADPQAD